MTKPLMKTTLCLTAVLALACAPAAFADHGRHGGWGHDGYRGHGERYRGGWGHEYRGGRYVYDRDGIGHWVAGALVLGALTNLIVDATQPPVVYQRAPVVYERAPVYPRTRVIYREAPPPRVYVDPYRTRYIGHVDDDDGGGD